MAHPNILDPKNCALVVVDVQEAFRTVIPQFEQIAVRISNAVRGFNLLGIPILVTEQYPKGLGPTVEEISLSLPEGTEVLEKKSFSACGYAPFRKILEQFDVNQIVLCGIETHVCVGQTAHDLLDVGFDVHVLTDCVASRFEHDREAGLSKMYGSGVDPSTVEMALFELLRDSGHDKFKEIQGLIK
ncbi:MAG: hydrolase [Pyrinomonadaceae bacterium]